MIGMDDPKQDEIETDDDPVANAWAEVLIDIHEKRKANADSDNQTEAESKRRMAMPNLPDPFVPFLRRWARFARKR